MLLSIKIKIIYQGDSSDLLSNQHHKTPATHGSGPEKGSFIVAATVNLELRTISAAGSETVDAGDSLVRIRGAHRWQLDPDQDGPCCHKVP